MPEQPADESTVDAAPVRAKLDVRKSIIMGVIGVALIVLIFWRVIPQIGSYNEAFDALQSMTWIALAIIVLAVVVYLAVYGLIYKAADGRLTYWQSQQVKQSAFTISNGVPAGGAVGLAVQFGMLASYRLSASSATAAITAVSVWATFTSLGLPILGVLALTITGTGDSVAWLGPLGLAVLVVIIVVFALVMRSEALARRVGNAANTVLRPLTQRISRLKGVDLAAPIMRFRSDMYDLVRRRWLLLTGVQIGIALTQFLILYAALRGVEGWGQAGTDILSAFGAFAVSQIMLMVPITPGGLGTMDALMIQLLVSSGTEKGAATAADLVWRATSYFPQILVGLIALLAWYRRAGQAVATRSVGEQPSDRTG
ncbi:MAG TPA: lysylphosphatidylglycerol synthase transmembrane domain-containing protein [Acidimicrobiia bacterium]